MTRGLISNESRTFERKEINKLSFNPEPMTKPISKKPSIIIGCKN